MILYVKLLTGKTVTIVAEPSDTILTIKERIRDKDGTPIDQQWLVHLGKKLENSRTIADYNIQNESKLFLCLKIRGGYATNKTK